MPGICHLEFAPVTITNPPLFSVHTRILSGCHPPSHKPGMADMGVASSCPQSSHPQWGRDGEEETWCSVQLYRNVLGSIFWSSDSQSEASWGPWALERGAPLVLQPIRRTGFCHHFLCFTQQTDSHPLIENGASLARKADKERESKSKRDTEKESQPLCVWINLRISMDDRSSGSPSTVKHPSGCALIVLLTLIVIKGLKTACRLWVTSRAKVATHLFIGDITALSTANTRVAVKSDRSAERDGFIWRILPL